MLPNFYFVTLFSSLYTGSIFLLSLLYFVYIPLHNDAIININKNTIP